MAEKYSRNWLPRIFIGGEPVSEQAHLFLDAVLHLPARTIELLIQVLRTPFVTAERSDDEAAVLALIEIFCLGHHAARSRPALVGPIVELGEPPGSLACLLVVAFGLMHLSADDPAQPLIALQAEDIIDLVLFAPAHQPLAAEARVGAQDDLHLRPAPA